jgi:hypothetical protein
MTLFEVKIAKGQIHAHDRYGRRYRINGLLIKRERGGEVLYTKNDNEHFCGCYSKGDFYRTAVCVGTCSKAFLISGNLINLI